MTTTLQDRQLTADDWFAMTDMPDGRVKVRVFWHGRVFMAARVTDGKRWLWASVTGRDVTFLPPKAEAAQWGPEPERWQPENPSRWIWPNGIAAMPLPVEVVPRMWNAMQSFQAVEEAESADLAREMEADRESARVHRRRDDGGVTGQRRQMWWLTWSPGSYSPKPSLKEVEGRLMRALAGDEEVSAKTHSGLHRSNALSRMSVEEARRLADAEARTPPEQVPKFAANGRDEDDYLVAMDWYASLGEAYHREVLFCASRMVNLTWGEIAMIAGLRRADAAAAIYRAALDEACKVANGEDTPAVRARRANLESVRDGNRGRV